MIEIKHLKTIHALNNAGSVVAAAERLFTSQSALSHQLNVLEKRIGEPLFKRKTFPLELTEKGEVLLALANKVLPHIVEAESQLKADPQSCLLSIGIECHACFDWLLPAISAFQLQQPKHKIELIGESLFALSTSLKEQSIVFTDTPQLATDMQMQVIGEFEMLLVMACDNPLADKEYIRPQDLATITLLTYPVEYQRLDIFKNFLHPANCQPAQWRKVENSHVIMQMVSAGLGVSALPDWLVKKHVQQGLMVAKPLTSDGIKKTLYAVYHQKNKVLADLFVPIAKNHYFQLINSE